MYSYTLLAIGSLVAVLNPFATVPPFVAMTQRNSAVERRAMAERACVIASAVLVLFSLSGMTVLAFFGITAPAFQIAGGLVLVRVAFELIQGSRRLRVTPAESMEGAEKEDISVTPLAIPILCGPATIATGVLLASQATTWAHLGLLVAVISVVYAGTFVVLRLASAHADRLGETPISISSRLMGLILLAIAVQFVIDGARATGLFSGGAI